MPTPDARIYVGRLEGGVPLVYAVDATSVTRLHPAGDRFDWGAEAGRAVEELARVLLADAAGSEPTPEVCRRFSSQILGRLPRDGFALQRDTVNAWLRRVVTV